jgi:hypothetical protein
MSRFWASDKELAIHIGNNVFKQDHVLLDIEKDSLRLKGELNFYDIVPFPKTAFLRGIMGPFCFIPFMECSHGILSMYHTLGGSLQVCGRTLDFTGGRGYIEQDWGRSFPRKYAWLQANDFTAQKDSFFLSVAEIPYLGRTFTCCICVLQCGGKEYRLATYLGVKTMDWTKHCIVLKQGGYVLQVSVQESAGHKLFAPSMGNLSRSIHERPVCHAHIILTKNGALLFTNQAQPPVLNL